MQLIFAFIAEINASFELNKRKLAFIQPLAVMVGRHTTEILTLKTKSIKNKK